MEWYVLSEWSCHCLPCSSSYNMLFWVHCMELTFWAHISQLACDSSTMFYTMCWFIAFYITDVYGLLQLCFLVSGFVLTFCQICHVSSLENSLHCLPCHIALRFGALLQIFCRVYGGPENKTKCVQLFLCTGVMWFVNTKGITYGSVGWKFDSPINRYALLI